VDVVPALEGGAKRLVLEELAALDRLVHAHEILEEDAPRPDGEVPDLGVPHLSRRQPDRLARRLQRRVRELAPEPVERRRARERDRVPRAGWGAAPADEDDEGIRAAAWHMAVKESTSSDAPPTSAPSTADCASRPAALSGLTEPP